MNWHSNKVIEFQAKHQAALEVGEDKEAAKHKVEYETYQEMIKQLNN